MVIFRVRVRLMVRFRGKSRVVVDVWVWFIIT